MSDYNRIATAIRWLDAHRHEQAGLDALAISQGLTVAGFLQLFSEWSGATPVNVVRCLSLADAGDLLRKGAATLDPELADDRSYCNPPHNLCVMLEAATPAEIKSGGSGLSITAGVAGSPFGDCLIAESPRGICHLSFFDEGDQAKPLEELRGAWPEADLRLDDRHAASLVEQIFHPTIPNATWKLFVRGTVFQLRIWQTLLRARPGSLVSYGTLAAAAGSPRASRATGSAVAANAISFLIPCHRVIRETGACGSYRWGSVRKRAILAWEAARADLPAIGPNSRNFPELASRPATPVHNPPLTPAPWPST